MKGFVHDSGTDPTTLSEIARVRVELSSDEFFGCFAYATQSGFRAFELSVGKTFWSETASRWLFGIDYGRTDPRALRAIADSANTEVRIYDGHYVLDQTSFIPRRDFHPKVAMMKQSNQNTHGLVLGSGNFSYNGLHRSVEAGAAILASNTTAYNAHIKPVRTAFESLWATSYPLNDVVDKYEHLLTQLINARDADKVVKKKSSKSGFWIEAGYVTKNRGGTKPGNQIFAPNGFRHFFDLKKKPDSSTNIGEITFETEIGKVTKNYRENDNGMEKLTLPIPEDHGFGVYDGKVLVFRPKGGRFLLTAVEMDEFQLAYGHRLVNINRMAGGRRFGELI